MQLCRSYFERADVIIRGQQDASSFLLHNLKIIIFKQLARKKILIQTMEAKVKNKILCQTIPHTSSTGTSLSLIPSITE
jgi:hypothetical protein